MCSWRFLQQLRRWRNFNLRRRATTRNLTIRIRWCSCCAVGFGIGIPQLFFTFLISLLVNLRLLRLRRILTLCTLRCCLGAFFLRNILNLTLLNFTRSLNNFIFFFNLPILVKQTFFSASPAGPLDEGFTGVTVGGFTGSSPGVNLGGSAGTPGSGFGSVVVGGSAGPVSPWW